MRFGISSLIVSVIAAGCAAAGSEPAGEQGVAELRVDAEPLAGPITRVTVESAGRSQDLQFNPATGTFDGTVFLPSGSQSLVASAFSDDTLVAQSRPTAAEITIGGVTRVAIRLLDLSVQGPQLFAPIIDTLSVPTTAEAGAAVTLAVTAVAPAGDELFYFWNSDCGDATFSAPSSPTTTWTKPSEGTCAVQVLVSSSNGFGVSTSFVIVVFPAGTGDGAVAVSSTLVTAPVPHLFFPNLFCAVAIGTNGSCEATIASPATTPYQFSVSTWGNSSPASLDLSDNCGGTFGVSQRGPDAVIGSWLPPAAGGVCILTARAVNSDGLSSTLSAAVLTRPGTVATAQPPQIGLSIDNGCFIVAPSPPVDCGEVQGLTRSIAGTVGWQDGTPGSLTITDSCAGPQRDPDFTSSFFASWLVPNTPGTTCTLTVRATSLQGSSTDAVARYHIAAPPM